MKEHEKRYSGKLFYVVFAFWYSMDIIMKTSLEEKVNLLLQSVLSVTTLDINAVVDFTVLALLIAQVLFFQEYALKEICIIFLITIPVVISTINSKNNYMISLFLFIVASKNVSIDRIVKVAYIILKILIPITLFLCFFGFIHDDILYRGSMVRHSLGFEHPNRLGLRFFQLAACYCYVNRKQSNRVFTYLMLISFILFTFYVPNSQTAYICLGLLLIVYSLDYLIDKYYLNPIIIMKMLFYGAAIMNVGTVFLCFISPERNALYNSIDKFMSRRFLWCNRMYHYYGVTWFGQKISTIVQDRKYVGIYRQWYLDNAYFAVLLIFGIVVYLIFTIAYLSAIYHFIKENNFMMVAILSLYGAYGIMTTGLYNMSHNIFLLALSSVLYSKKDSEMEISHVSKVRFSLKKTTDAKLIRYNW